MTVGDNYSRGFDFNAVLPRIPRYLNSEQDAERIGGTLYIDSTRNGRTFSFGVNYKF